MAENKQATDMEYKGQLEMAYPPPPPYTPPPPPLPLSSNPPIQTIINVSSATSTCRHCGTPLVVHSKHVNTYRTHCCAFFMCISLCWPFCLLPYFMNACQEQRVACASCGQYM